MERIHLKFDSLYFNSIGAYLHDKASNLQEKVKTVFKETKRMRLLVLGHGEPLLRMAWWLSLEVLVVFHGLPVAAPSESLCPEQSVAEVASLYHVGMVEAAV